MKLKLGFKNQLRNFWNWRRHGIKITNISVSYRYFDCENPGLTDYDCSECPMNTLCANDEHFSKDKMRQ